MDAPVSKLIIKYAFFSKKQNKFKLATVPLVDMFNIIQILLSIILKEIIN